MPRCLERWADRTLTRFRSARRVFDVDNGPTTEGEAQDVVALAVASGGANVTYGSVHPLEPGLTVPANGIDVQPIVPGYYRVTVSYEGTATSGDPGTLFSRKWQVLPTEIIAVEVDADMTFDQQPVLNSALQPYDSPVSRSVNWYRFRLRRYESGEDLLQKNLLYQRRTNADAVTLPRYGTAAIGELLLISIAQVQSQEQGVSTSVLVEYTIEARPTREVSFDDGEPVQIHGWHTRRLDAGTHALVSDDGWYPSPIKRNGEVVSEPVRLNGKGWPIESGYVVFKRDQKTPATNDAYFEPGASIVRETCSTGGQKSVFLSFDCTEGPIALAGLNIDANL